MPRGLPDYGQQAEQYAIAGMADLGEAVARLNSINVFDRRGFTVWMDDFEAPVLRWVAEVGGPGVLPVLQTPIAFSGIQCVHLSAPVGLNSASRIGRRFPLLRLGRFGHEVWICGLTADPSVIYLRFTVSDGVNLTQGEWRIDTTNNTISIQSGGVTHVIASNVYASIKDRYFLPVKIVADMDTDYYVRLIVGPDEYDLSAYPLEVVGGPAERYIITLISAAGGGALAACEAYIDSYILTQNEP